VIRYIYNITQNRQQQNRNTEFGSPFPFQVFGRKIISNQVGITHIQNKKTIVFNGPIKLRTKTAEKGACPEDPKDRLKNPERYMPEIFFGFLYCKYEIMKGHNRGI
jgi:hypothetical protein